VARRTVDGNRGYLLLAAGAAGAYSAGLSFMSALLPHGYDDTHVAAWNRDLQSRTATERVRWALEEFRGHAVLSTSFGVQAAVMLHLVTRIDPQIPVVFIDTGYLFPETYRFADELTEKLGLNLKVFAPAMTAARQEAVYGKLWEQGVEGLEKYGRLNKVEPMNRALAELGAKVWITGLRREHASTREDLPVLKRQNRVLKLHPIVDWSDRQIGEYLRGHGLPYHPLWEQGYVSIGDTHSTTRYADGMKPEDTRFSGLKRECGLHEQSGEPEYMI
jgi:phosphoadenosine phosphosulfate reductase